MHKIICSLFFTFFLFCVADGAGAVPPVTQGSFVKVAAAILYDVDNDVVLFEQNADQPIPPASLTKIMSMFLARDHIKAGKASFDSLVPVSVQAASTGGSLMGVRAGESVSLRKLLLGMAVSSGNDASHAVAEYVGGTAPAFVEMMNARAKELGMSNSHFLNPHGMPAQGQVVTARDMLTLAVAYYKAHPDCLDMHNQLLLEHHGYTTWNKNALIGQYEGADGMKTGWIRASGHNLVFTAKRDGRRLIGVILGAPDATTRAAEACHLLDAGFQVCKNEAVTVTAALDATPLDLERVDVLKTARENGLIKRRPLNPRLLAARKALRGLGKHVSRLPKPKTSRAAKAPAKNRTTAIAKNKPAPVKNAAKRKAHASGRQNKAKRG